MLALLARSAVEGLAALALQNEPPRLVGPGEERWSAVRIDLSGRVDLHYSTVGPEVNEAVGGTATQGNFWSGRFGLRVDATVQDDVLGVVEIENRSFDDGMNLPLSSDPGEDGFAVKQGFLQISRFLSDRLLLRAGIQRLGVRSRPHDAPFFLDLGETESFFSGVSGAGDGAWAPDRNILEATGVRLQWMPFEILTVDAYWLLVAEGGPTASDETVYGLMASARIADAMAVWLLVSAVSGGPGLGTVWTLGGGWNGYLGEGKPVEIFIEGYFQVGETAPSVGHQAYAANAGARWLAGLVWVEAGVELRSGDRAAADGRSEAFLSYENQNRFVIVQSAEFGLDVDTNVVVVRGAVGLGPFDVASHPLRFRVDVGRFKALESFALAAGGDWGLETDLTVVWEWNASLSLSVQGAWLASSELLEALTAAARNHTWSVLVGAFLRF